jgi:hypothetical protein
MSCFTASSSALSRAIPSDNAFAKTKTPKAKTTLPTIIRDQASNCGLLFDSLAEIDLCQYSTMINLIINAAAIAEA